MHMEPDIAYNPGGNEAAEVAPAQAPVSRVPLRVALLFSAANLGANLVFAFFNFAMPQYLDSYHLAPQFIGLLANERSFVGGFIQPFIGRLSDRTRTRFGRRRPFFLVGVPLTAIALLILAVHPPFAVMIAIVPVAGFFLFIAFDPYLAMMADITPPAERGRIGASMAVAAMLGAILFNLAAGFLWATHEFAVFLLTVIGLILAFGVTFIAVREPPHPVATPPVPRNPLRYLRDLRGHTGLTRYIVVLGLFYLGSGGATPFVTLFATKALGVPSGEAFFLLIVLVLCTAIGAVPAGLLADRIGKRPVLMAGMALFGCGALIGSQVPTLGWAIPVMVLVGLGNACPTTLAVPLLADLIPAQRTGELIGLGSFVWSIAQPIGSFSAGLFVTSALPFTYRHAFIWAGVLTVSAAAAMLLVRQERAREEGA